MSVLVKGMKMPNNCGCCPFRLTAEEIKRNLKKADLVEVTRCKDCRYVIRDVSQSGKEYMSCLYLSRNWCPAPDFYCAFGKRRDDE